MIGNKIRFLDLSLEGDELDQIIEITRSVYKSGQLVMGDKVIQFEDKVSKYCEENMQRQ